MTSGRQNEMLKILVPAFDLIWKWMRQMSLNIKYQVSSTKKMDKKADLASPRKKYKKLWTRPSQKQQKIHKVQNEIV